MQNDRLLECLDADYWRMHTVAASADLDVRVPSCPDWTLKDLVEHTAMVYLHKVKVTELGSNEEAGWPPDISGRSTLPLFEDAYSQLMNMFATHDPSDHSGTWYDPEQTVGFWIRRMAQETVIHRRDAELAVGDATPADPELAEDGIAELLDIFISYPTHKWNDESQPVLEPADGDTVLVDADGARWLATIGLGGVEVTRPDHVPEATVTITGTASDVLFWLWSRAAESDGAVEVTGSDDAVERLRHLLTVCTQ